MKESIEDYQLFSQLCLGNHIIKKKNQRDLTAIKIAYRPYTTTRSFYDRLTEHTKIWQKIIYQAARDQKFIDKVFEETKTQDPFIQKLFAIRKNKKQKNIKERLDFVIARTDYFINLQNLPKIIEYNLFSVSMYAHIQNLQQTKKVFDLENSSKYLENTPNLEITGQIAHIYKKYELKGIFLFVGDQNEKNTIEQRRIMFQLLKHGIKVKKITLVNAGEQLSLDNQNNLILQNEMISFVLFRTGYTLKSYEQDQKLTWKAREIIQLSNAIKIPSIPYDLMNQKRMQVELSKKSVYSQFLTASQIKIFEETLVPTWQFDHITDKQFQDLITYLSTDNPHSKAFQYVLKPNSEGGGNNFYKQKAIETLISLSKEERKKYILMQLIQTKPIQNVIISNNLHTKTQCLYEVSQYGLIIHNQTELLQNQQNGFLIRIKPKNENQGGILQGCGSLCSWMFEQ